MNTMTVLAIAAFGFTVAGCAKREAPPPPASSPPPPSTPLLAKTAPTGNPVPCVESPGNKCVIEIAVTPDAGGCSGNAVSLPEFVELLDDQKHKKIEWQLPTGYHFCPRAGDGVFQDSAAVPEDLFDVDWNGRCSNKFTWHRKQQDTKNYAYFLRFRDEQNTVVCIKDPWIKNG